MNAYRAGIDIQDIVNAYIAVIEKGSWKNLIYNLGHYNLSKKQFAEGIKSVVNCKIEEIPSFGDLRNLQIDYTLFNNEFNFKPRVKYEETIKNLVKWLKINKNKMEKTNFVGVLNMPIDQWKKII
jgi:nucleoside-diphosphate-sugar epimerase